MPDVNVSVNIDGKTVFVHGAAATPDPHAVVLYALEAAVRHFEAQKAALTPPATSARSVYDQSGMSINQKGPSL